MQKTIAHILVVCLLACLFAACSDNVDALVQESRPVQVGFTLSTGGGYGSRAAHGTATDEAGTGYENYIDVVGRDFRFYIFDDDNKFVDELKVLMVMPTDNSEYPSTYHLTAELNNLPPADEDFKVVAIASWDNYPTNLKVGETTIEDICESSEYAYKHSSNDPFIPSETHKIPMYGVMTHEPVEFKPNLSTDLGTINMLRAMAKVEVKLHNDVANYTLEAVKLHNFTENGMAAPHGIYDNTGGDCTATLDELHMDHDYTVNTSPLTFPIKSEDGKSWTIYIPEYKNVGYVAPCYITVTLRHGDHTKDYPIYFRNYENGKPKDGEQIDIVRNHHYQFVITKVGGSISINYQVADWVHDKNEHYWEQTFSYPTYMNLRPWDERTKEHESDIVYPSSPTMYYDEQNPEEGAFVVAFKMTEPGGQKWKPTFHNSNSDEFRFEIYTENGTLLANEDDWVAKNEWYQIRLIPKKKENQGQTVEFGIATTLNWENRSLFLLINGEDEETIRWPNSGSDARLIKVTQIEKPTNGGNDENEGGT